MTITSNTETGPEKVLRVPPAVIDLGDRPAMNTTSIVRPSPGAVATVNQMYREYLNAQFQKGYYQELYGRTIKYSRVFDYSIGLGSAMSGGSGLGILASPNFAWICAGMTTVSVLLSIAKGVWDWPAKSKFGLDRVQFYDNLCAGYRSLVDDVNAQQDWTDEFARRRNGLRANSTPGAPDPYPQLSEKTKRSVQNGVKARIPYQSWWEWRA
jgi:hypothetical protein